MDNVFNNFESRNNSYFRINDLSSAPVFIKTEGLNGAGSIKMKSAIAMVDRLIDNGELYEGKTLIESSSGNLGVALSMICRAKGFKFICVTDANASNQSKNIIKVFGGDVVVIDTPDKNGGFLANRIEYIKKRCIEDPSLVWVNQYENEGNWQAHYFSTAMEIHGHFDKVDWLFVGAGTCGTLMGCARYFKKYSPRTKVVAVDSAGSITFGGAPSRRRIPGLGTSKVPSILDTSFVDELVHIEEIDTIKACRMLVDKGLLVGGSTGTVISAIMEYRDKIKSGDVVVTISPDLGYKYLDTIYCDDWVNQHYTACNTPLTN